MPKHLENAPVTNETSFGVWYYRCNSLLRLALASISPLSPIFLPQGIDWVSRRSYRHDPDLHDARFCFDHFGYFRSVGSPSNPYSQSILNIDELTRFLCGEMPIDKIARSKLSADVS